MVELGGRWAAVGNLRSPVAASGPAAFRPSWLCPTERDWQRFLDLEVRIRPMRALIVVSLILPGTVVAATTGALAWLTALAALLTHGVFNWLSERRPPSVWRGVMTVVTFQLVLLAVVSVTGGLASPCLPWLAVPNTVLATRFRPRVVFVGVVLTVLSAGLVTTLVPSAPGVAYSPVITMLCLAGLVAACGACVIALQGAEVASRDAADQDALTGLLNRKPLQQQLERQLVAARTGRTCAVLVCDLDHFKSVNDEHGHLRGDEVLRGAAARLRGDARPGDSVYRLGGEEFVVVVPDVDEMTAVGVAERMRAAIAAWPIARVPISVSIGVAMVDPDSTDAADVLGRADAALYAAKRAGRNRVCSDTGTLAPAAPEPAYASGPTWEAG